MNTNNLKLIYSRRLAWYLRKQGFKIVKVEPNYSKPEFDVYFFEQTEELNEAVNTYLANR